MSALPLIQAIEDAKAYTKIHPGYAVICEDKKRPNDYYWFYSGNPSPEQFETVAAVKNGELIQGKTINMIRDTNGRFIQVKFYKTPAYKAGQKIPVNFAEIDNVLNKTGHAPEEKEARILQMEFKPLIWQESMCYYMERVTAEAKPDPIPLFFE